jgi:phosphoglycerate dehydrogenase-like enzyme
MATNSFVPPAGWREPTPHHRSPGLDSEHQPQDLGKNAPVKIGIIGAGRIGGGIATQLGGAGHEIFLSFSRDESKLAELASQVSATAKWGQYRRPFASAT